MLLLFRLFRDILSKSLNLSINFGLGFDFLSKKTVTGSALKIVNFESSLLELESKKTACFKFLQALLICSALKHITIWCQFSIVLCLMIVLVTTILNVVFV